jgi:glycosyltransferase involved in cell wall biosynthesis
VDEVRRLARLFSELRPDVVHTHNLHAHFYATPAARLARVPAVVHTRHGAALGATRHGRLLFWAACRMADRVVSVSADTGRLSAREGRLRPGQGVTIWNGIDIGRFPYRGPAAGPNLITISRLEPVKDLPTLLKAAAAARRQGPALRLTVVGHGSERAALQALAQALDLGDAVAFLGERADVAPLLASAAVFVSSSSSEGVSLTLLEAMAVGLPVVATAVGGNPEVVEHGVTGELVPAAAPEALAAAIVRVCEDPSRAAALGRAGRARVDRHFDVRQMVAAYERLYDGVLREKGRS